MQERKLERFEKVFICRFKGESQLLRVTESQLENEILYSGIPLYKEHWGYVVLKPIFHVNHNEKRGKWKVFFSNTVFLKLFYKVHNISTTSYTIIEDMISKKDMENSIVY